MNATTTTIAKIASEVYGAGIGVFDPVWMLWAADKAADIVGVEIAKKELTKINRAREKMGLPVACFEYGHRMF